MVPDRPPISVLVLVLLIMVMPFPVILFDFTPSVDRYDTAVILFPLEIALAVLIAVSAGDVVRSLRTRCSGVGAAGWLLLSAVISIAFAAHPSGRGMVVLLHLWGAGVIAASVPRLSPVHRRLVAGVVGAVAVLETIWALAQGVTSGGLGLEALGESPYPLYPFGRVLAPQGSMVHIYVLAGLGLVAAGVLACQAVSSSRPVPWAAAAGVSVAPVGVTYSRAGAVGLALLGGAVLAAAIRADRRRAALMIAAALALGSGIPALVWSSGWQSRVQQSVGHDRAEGVATDRGTLQREAVGLIEDHPLTGAGPGRYYVALQAKEKVERNRRVRIFKPVHDLPLLAGAEGGVGALLVMAGLLVAVGWRALRSGPVATGLYLAYLPFCLVDHFPYSFPQGVVLTGLWLGFLDLEARRRRAGEALVG